MMTRLDWLLFVVLPPAFVIALDQGTKTWAMRALTDERDIGPLRLVTFLNHGFMLGSMKDLSGMITSVFPATLGAFFIYMLLVVQFFLPLKSNTMRAGLSLYVGSIVANAVDRVRLGAVVDFLQLSTPFGPTGVFNVADAAQWVGAALFLGSFIANRAILYPIEQRRGRKWIDPAFQARFCAVLVALGATFSLILGALSYTYLREALLELAPQRVDAARSLLQTFAWLIVVVGSAFLATLAVVGIYLSHRIIGPIHAFEAFVEDLIRGRARQLKLRRNDELRQLEEIGSRLRLHVHDKIGVAGQALAASTLAPELRGVTPDRQPIELTTFLGRKVWLIFYRYASCPICALHAADTADLYEEAVAAGVAVIAVFETPAAAWEEEAMAATPRSLKELGVVVVFDAEKKLYSAYRTRRRLSGLLRPSTLKVLWNAHRRGFKQRQIVGALDQMPAHVLIDEAGVISAVYYGRSVYDHIPRASVERFINC